MFLTGDVASAYSFSAEFGIAPIRGNTLSSLLFVTVLPKQSLQSTSNEHLYCVLCSEVLSYCCAKVLIVPAEGKMSDSDREPRLEFNVSVRHRYGDIISDSCCVLYYKYSKILILFKGQ
jgi:hypothetical protein